MKRNYKSVSKTLNAHIYSFFGTKLPQKDKSDVIIQNSHSSHCILHLGTNDLRKIILICLRDTISIDRSAKERYVQSKS